MHRTNRKVREFNHEALDVYNLVSFLHRWRQFAGIRISNLSILIFKMSWICVGRLRVYWFHSLDFNLFIYMHFSPVIQSATSDLSICHLQNQSSPFDCDLQTYRKSAKQFFSFVSRFSNTLVASYWFDHDLNSIFIKNVPWQTCQEEQLFHGCLYSIEQPGHWYWSSNMVSAIGPYARLRRVSGGKIFLSFSFFQ